MSTSIFYRVLRKYVIFCSKLYFKKVEVHGLENIPSTGPVIFAANHQNAFLDAILIHIGQPRTPHFLTRGDVFEKALPNFIMRSLNMHPIYRLRDGIKNVKRNETTFSECYEILESGRALGIFPEGNHNSKFFLRTVQRGCSRIVFDTEKRNSFKLGIKVIPVGIQYYGGQHSRSNVLIQFGEPIQNEDLLESPDERAFQFEFTKRLSESMANLILNFPESTYDEEIQKWISKRSADSPSLIDTFKQDQQLIAGAPANYTANNSNNSLKRTIMLPLAIYGGLNHLIIYPLFLLTMNKLVTDNDFLGSIKFGAAMIYFPLVYAFQTWALSGILGNWSGLYFVTLPLFGIICRDYISNRRTSLYVK